MRCSICIRKRKTGNDTAAIDQWVKRIVPWPPTPDNTIEFLEFTASNMCNQTCTMCGSDCILQSGAILKEKQ